MKLLVAIAFMFAAGLFSWSQGPTPSADEDLLAAAAAGDESGLRESLARGAHPDAVDAAGKTALYLAAEKGFVSIAGSLLKAGANPDQVKMMTQPFVSDISYERDVSGFAVLEGIVATIRFPSAEEYLFSPLMAAARNGDLEMVKLLLDAGADIDYLRACPVSLVAAEFHKREAMAESLVLASSLKGAAYFKIDFGTVASGSKYHADAASSGSPAWAAIMVREGAWAQIAERIDAFILELNRENGQIGGMAAALAVSRPEEIDPMNRETALSLALKRGHADIARFLIENDADVRRLNYLEMAVSSGDLGLVEEMISAGARVDFDNWGIGCYTALMAAAADGNTDIARSLLAHGAKINARYRANDTTPLSAATEGKHEEMAAFLRSRGGLVFKGLFIDLQAAPVMAMTDGSYFDDVEDGFGIGLRARGMFGDLFGLFTGVSYEQTGHPYLRPLYTMSICTLSLELGVFVRDYSNLILAYGLWDLPGTWYANGPEAGKFSKDEDFANGLCFEAGIRLRLNRDLGIFAFYKAASYEYWSLSTDSQDGSLSIFGAGLSYQR